MTYPYSLLDEFERLLLDDISDPGLTRFTRERIASIYRGRAAALLRPDEPETEEDIAFPDEETRPR
jgi:hypothetical protein